MCLWKKPADLVLMMAVLWLSVLLWGCQGEQDKAGAHIKAGKVYFSEAQYQKARIEFLNATRITPDDPNAWFLLGETMTRLGNAEKAFQSYSRAEKLDSDNPEILLKTASLFFLAGKLKPADERIEKVLANDPENTTALFLKARLLDRNGEPLPAIALFEKIIAKTPDHMGAIEKLAALKTRQKDYAGAEELLLKAVSINEKAVAPRMILAGFYSIIKDFDKAEAQLLIAGRIAPENIDIPILLGNFYLQMKDETAAEAAYKKAMKIAPGSVKPHLAMAQFYDVTHQKDKALQMYKKALTLEPDNFSTKITLGNYYLKSGDIQNASILVSAILEARPRFFPGLLLDSEIKIRESSHEEALRGLQTLEKDHPESARLYYLKGLCHLELGEKQNAIAAFVRSVDLDPGQIPPRTRLARLYYENRELSLAKETALAVLARSPEDFQAVDTLANSDMALGNLEKARKGFEKLIEMEPDNPRGYHLLGLMFAHEKIYDLSNYNLHEALDRSPFALDMIRLLVQNHINQLDFSGALEVIQKQLNVAGASPRFKASLHHLAGNLWLIQKNSARALTSFQKAVDVDPDFPQSYYTIARIYNRSGNQDKAIEHYTRLLDKNPGLASPHMMLGILMDARSEYDAAAAHYKRALDINPRYALAANNLAYHLIKRTDQVDKALVWARVAREALPEDPAVMDTMGLVYLKKGLVDSAIMEFRDSLKKTGDNPVVLLHLAHAYRENNDIDNAVIALKKVLELEKNQGLRDQATELLNQIGKQGSP